MTAMSDGPYISEQHPSSHRYAVFEDDGASAWLYLTAPDELRPVADVWVYNRHPPAERIDKSDRSRPPPIVRKFAASNAVVDDPSRSHWHFAWSSDGESVALRRDDLIVAVILSGQRRGCSSAIAAECPWGSPLRPEHIAGALYASEVQHIRGRRDDLRSADEA